MSGSIVGVDLGGTNVRIGAIDPDDRAPGGAVVSRPSSLRGSERPAGALYEIISSVMAGGAVDAVGIAATGPVDRTARVIRNEFNLPDWTGTGWVAELEQLLGAPVILDNDAVGALVGEAEYGAGVGADLTAMVTLGTGVGVAAYSRGRGTLRGAHGFHPEGGHIPIASDGPPCYCGVAGCWEPLSCGESLRGLWRVDDGTVDWAGYGRTLARGLRTVARMLGPDRIVIGGGISERFDDYFPRLQEAFADPDPMGHPHGVSIVRAQLEHPAVLGAAALARQHLERVALSQQTDTE